MPINHKKYLSLFGLTLMISACKENLTLINDTQTPFLNLVHDIQPNSFENERQISDNKDNKDNKDISSNKTEQLIQVNSQKFIFNGPLSLQEIEKY